MKRNQAVEAGFARQRAVAGMAHTTPRLFRAVLNAENADRATRNAPPEAERAMWTRTTLASTN